MVRNILYALGPKQTLTPGASISWAFDGRPAVVDLSENGTLTVTGPIADFPMVGLLKVTHVVAGTELTLTGDSSNVAWSTGAGQHTILEFVWDGTEYVWTSRTKTATAALTQLSTPASFAATAASDTQIDLSWTDGANESSYLIEVSDTGTGGWSTLATPAAGSTSYSHTGLTAETTKYYRVKAVGDGTTYSDSAYATANATTEAESTTKAAAYISAVQAAGGTLSTAEQTALSDFETTINSIGASKFKQILLYAGGTAGSAVIDFMGNQNATLVGSPTVDAFGVVLNGTSQYVNSGMVPSAHFTINDIGFSQKLKTNAANNHRSGVYVDATGDLIGLTLNGDGVNTYLLCGNLSTVVSIDNPLTGYHVPMTVLRRSSTDSECYISGASFVNNSTDAFSALPGIAMFYGAQNWNGTPMYFTGNTLEFDAMHTGLTDAEVNSLHTAINSLMTALGR